MLHAICMLKKKPHDKLTNYELINMVGKGATSEVWLCQQKKTKEKSVIKIITNSHFRKTIGHETSLNELKILEKLSHHWIITLKSNFPNCQDYFWVDYVPNGTLLERIKTQALDRSSIRFYIAQLAIVLDYLESKSILHGDLKPENVLIGEDGYIKLTDFGSARDLNLSNSQPAGLTGTPFYLAPEILSGEGYSYPADWYALGIMMFEMLNGEPPFTGHLLNICREIIHNEISYPKEFLMEEIDLIQNLTKKQPKERFSSLSHVSHHTWFDGFDWIGVILTLARYPYNRGSIFK